MKKVVIVSLILAGCSNADMSKLNAWGKRHDVRCFSGGQMIFEGYTTGKVENEAHSDGYYFQDEKTGKFTTVSGACIITVGNK